MTDNNILLSLSRDAGCLLEEDLDEWIVPQLCEHYAIKIKSLATYAYGSTIHRNGDGLHVALQAFRERAKAEIRSAVNTFLFVSQHWRTGRDINTYLLTCLGRMASGIHNDVDGQRQVSVPVCPACREYGQKEYLVPDSKGSFRCESCFSKIETLEDGVEREFRRVFATHSRLGVRCPDCEKFIPKSFDGSSCPYNDCSWFGNIDFLDKMSHPTGLGSDNLLSLNYSVDCHKGDTIKVEAQDRIDGGTISACSSLEIAEQYKIELDALKSVINDQIESIKRNGSAERVVLKLLMYQAYKNLVETQPDDMVSYLVHLKHSGVASPVQSRIFQEYVKLLEAALPFTISKGGTTTAEICSLLDPNLNLFLGVSEFDGTVTSEGRIPNNTIETYTGGRLQKFFGPCFIGMLIKVTHRNTGENLNSSVVSYTFSHINMKDDVPTHSPVKVQHFRLASHYELGALVNLQRSRRKIVDSVYFRLNKEKREVSK